VRKAAAMGLGNAPTKTVIDSLVASLEGDPSRDVRTACFVSLGRLNCDTGNAYLSHRMGVEGRAIFATVWPWAIYRSAHAFHAEIINSLILIAPSDIDRRQPAKHHSLIPSALELCALLETELAHEYCARVVLSCPTPNLFLTAYAILPVAQRRELVGSAVAVIEQVERQMEAAKFEERLECLRGGCAPEIERLLLRLLAVRDGSRVRLKAFDILLSDYPQAVLPELSNWLRRGRIYWLRVRAARELAERRAPKGLEEIL